MDAPTFLYVKAYILVKELASFVKERRKTVNLNNMGQMAELAKNMVGRSVTVPGVQAKLSMLLVKEAQEKTDGRLTVVEALGGFIFLNYPPKTLKRCQLMGTYVVN